MVIVNGEKNIEFWWNECKAACNFIAMAKLFVLSLTTIWSLCVNTKQNQIFSCIAYIILFLVGCLGWKEFQAELRKKMLDISCIFVFSMLNAFIIITPMFNCSSVQLSSILLKPVKTIFYFIKARQSVNGVVGSTC